MTNTNTNLTKVSRGSLEKENLLQVQSEKIEMTLNTDNAIASGLLIQRLTELYEDPIEASVRETVSNGFDAVAAAYSGDQPEVYIEMPTELNPVFVVRDNGVGMSYDDLKEIYSKYGASTKMNNFDQIGAYGLGAKAPLAYGSQFTVSSVKDGHKTTIIVAREELTNYIKVIDSFETDEQSGTTVSIPVASNDIERFVTHARKYAENPADFKVNLYINGEKVENDGYVELTDDMVIFSKNGEEITARMWIRKDEANIVSLINNMTENDFRRSLQYVIGGWAYGSPSRRNSYYRGQAATVIVELKPGVVAFNSARDAILENERYHELENLVVKYVKSEAFLGRMTKLINTLDAETFKSVVMSLLRRNENDLRIQNGKLIVKNHNSNSNYYITHDFELAKFVHEETGFDFNHILKGVPTTNEKAAVLVEKKQGYRKTSDYALMKSYVPEDANEEIRHRPFHGASSKEALEELDEIMYDSSPSHSLADLMLNLSLLGYAQKEKGSMRITFITDLIADIDDKKCSFAKMRSSRKSIVRMRNEGKSDSSYNSYLIYTTHTKADIEKMIKEAQLNDLDLLVASASEMTEKLSEFLKNNREVTTAREVNKNLSTSFNVLDSEKNTVNNAQPSAVDEEKTNIIVISRERYMSPVEMKMVQAWYCNENNLKSEDVVVYSSIGLHRVIDLTILSSLGEIYENPQSPNAGNSNLYAETVRGRRAKFHTLNKTEAGVEKKAFTRLLAASGYANVSSVMSRINSGITELSEIATLVGFELSQAPVDLLNELGEFGDKEFGRGYGYSHWSLNNDSMKQLVELLDKDKYEVIEFLTGLNSNNGSQFAITDDGEISTVSVDKLIPSYSTLRTIYEGNRENSARAKFIKSQVEAYLTMVDEMFKKLSTINFK